MKRRNFLKITGAGSAPMLAMPDFSRAVVKNSFNVSPVQIIFPLISNLQVPLSLMKLTDCQLRLPKERA